MKRLLLVLFFLCLPLVSHGADGDEYVPSSNRGDIVRKSIVLCDSKGSGDQGTACGEVDLLASSYGIPSSWSVEIAKATTCAAGVNASVRTRHSTNDDQITVTTLTTGGTIRSNIAYPPPRYIDAFLTLMTSCVDFDLVLILDYQGKR